MGGSSIREPREEAFRLQIVRVEEDEELTAGCAIPAFRALEVPPFRCWTTTIRPP